MKDELLAFVMGLGLFTVICLGLATFFFVGMQIISNEPNSVETDWFKTAIVSAGPDNLVYNKHKYILVKWTATMKESGRKELVDMSQYQLLHDPDCPCKFPVH